MKNQLFMASCPVCGRSIFKGTANSYIEGGCPKCKNFLQISYTNDGVKVMLPFPNEDKESRQAKA